jgi:hypothetical protein
VNSLKIRLLLLLPFVVILGCCFGDDTDIMLRVEALMMMVLLCVGVGGPDS